MRNKSREVIFWKKDNPSKYFIELLKKVLNDFNNTVIQFLRNEDYSNVMKIRREVKRRHQQILDLQTEYLLSTIFDMGEKDIKIAEEILKQQFVSKSEYFIVKHIIGFWSYPKMLTVLFDPHELERDESGMYGSHVQVILDLISKCAICNSILLEKFGIGDNEFYSYLEYARHYNDIGFNVTCITKEVNEYNREEKNLDKSPSHEWKNFYFEKQEFAILKEYNWSNAVGVGLVLKYDDIRVIDIDGCKNIGFIDSILEILRLPDNYPWIVVSGSNNGFHILLKNSSKIIDIINNSETINLKTPEEDIVAFGPNDAYTEVFKRIEFRWENHLVLPPSTHESSEKYRFVNGFIPNSLPTSVDDKLVLKLLLICCNNARGTVITSHGAVKAINLKFIDPEK